MPVAMLAASSRFNLIGFISPPQAEVSDVAGVGLQNSIPNGSKPLLRVRKNPGNQPSSLDTLGKSCGFAAPLLNGCVLRSVP
jgi:hypothetical protein